jgi:enoyl-CoA hydratase/carnithine racemase
MNAAWLALRYPPTVGMQLALSCRRFKGPDLLRMGIALDVVADGGVVEHGRRLAERIAAYPGSASRLTKRILRQTRGEADRLAATLVTALSAGESHLGGAL